MCSQYSPNRLTQIRTKAVEGDHVTDKRQGNKNAQRALDSDGMPKDRIAIAEDVIGANADHTEG